MRDKGINSNLVYNISKKGQEMSEAAYGIQGIAKGYYKSITS